MSKSTTGRHIFRVKAEGQPHSAVCSHLRSSSSDVQNTTARSSFYNFNSFRESDCVEIGLPVTESAEIH